LPNSFVSLTRRPDFYYLKAVQLSRRTFPPPFNGQIKISESFHFYSENHFNVRRMKGGARSYGIEVGWYEKRLIART